MVTAFLENTYVSPPATHAASASEAQHEHGVTLVYDDAMDELQILFEAGPVQRYVEPLNRYLSMLVATESDIPFGFMVESFLTHAVHEFPQLRPVVMYLQLGERPYRDPNLYRQDAPPRTSFPDIAWKQAAHDAIHNVVEITGGIVQ